MNKVIKKNNLLAVRVEPWQLFRFKKFLEYTKKRPSIAIQEALQLYLSSFAIPDLVKTTWLDEYNNQKGDDQ